ncbi:hypothetical protein [Microbacterium testaceum]|uniref:hypothetical protein n=1 Tax=Microbacterium testaceum TaxID=2033 RepID=UPI000734955C|nr:hypothetical protein [Microbacterium testaceum]
MIGYARASDLSLTADGARLSLATADALTPAGPVVRPSFFSGFVSRPDAVAAALLAVADVAATSYYELSARRASLDPVVTASGDRLRFEAFSRCNGVYARFDLLSDGIDAGEVGYGTTNVDINPPLRHALASTQLADLLHLDVGEGGLAVATAEQTHLERPVDLPDRWIRGFAEVPTIAARMRLVAEVDRLPTMTFLASLRSGAPGPTVHYAPGPRGLQPSAVRRESDVRLAGTSRLSAARRVMRFAHRMRAYAHDSGASGWVVDVPGGRVTFIITAEPYRGFSGEGGLLHALGDVDDDGLSAVAACLAWQPVIDADAIARETSLTRRRVDGALAVFAVSGRVGFDLAEGAWFHRELPLDPSRVGGDHARLERARELVSSEQTVLTEGMCRVVADGAVHWVRESGGILHCTCRWHARYGHSRGPCAHELAARLLFASPTQDGRR